MPDGTLVKSLHMLEPSSGLSWLMCDKLHSMQILAMSCEDPRGHAPHVEAHEGASELVPQPSRIRQC